MISIVTALNSEAKSFIDYFGLRQTLAKPFAYYASQDQEGEVEVLISGVGALAMSTAVGWLAGRYPRARVWLNVGVAGHATMQLGDVALVHGCADALDSHAHYPPLIAKWRPATTAPCLSYNAPCTDYPGEALVDMEANSFFIAAGKFSSSEFVQSIKVVSDNPSSSIESLNAKMVHALIAPHTGSIVDFARELQALHDDTVTRVTHDIDISAHRATHSQLQQAHELINKAQVLGCLDQSLEDELSQCNSIQQVLQCLTRSTLMRSPVIAHG